MVMTQKLVLKIGRRSALWWWVCGQTYCEKGIGMDGDVGWL